MKRGYLGTYIKLIFIIFVIVGIAIGASYYIRQKYEEETIKTVETDMLLIEAKTKIVAEKVKIKEKDASYVGKKIKEFEEDESIKQLKEKGIINLEEKDVKYYVLNKESLEQLGLNDIKLEKGYYIVEYSKNEIIYSEGVEDNNGNIIYKLSDFNK